MKERGRWFLTVSYLVYNTEVDSSTFVLTRFSIKHMYSMKETFMIRKISMLIITIQQTDKMRILTYCTQDTCL